MNFAEYTQLALRTKSPTYTRDHLMMGLFGEAGEVVDLIKKVVAHGHPVTPELCDKMRAEIGDVLWHIALGADEDQVRLCNVFVTASTASPSFVFVNKTNLSDLAKEIRDDVHNIEDITEWANASCAYENIIHVLAEVASIFSTTLEQCAIENIEKLRKRYPDGFSSEASQARVDVVVDGVVHGDLSDMWATAKTAATDLFGAPVVAKEFVLERTRRGFSDVPWYLYPTLGGSSHLAWTNKEEHAIRFKTADDALKALDGDKRFTREAYVFRAKAVTQ